MIPQLTPSEGHAGILRPTYVLNQAPYLTNNWKSLQHSELNDYGRFIKVSEGVATLTNGETLLRCPLPNIPEGFYIIDDNNILIYAEDEMREMIESSSRFYSHTPKFFPDPESIRPNFKVLTHTPPVARDEVRVIMDFLNHVRSTYDNDEENYNPALVCIEGDTISSWKDANVWLKLSCPFPVNLNGEVFGANRLRHLMTDMLRYDHIFVGKDQRPVGIGMEPPSTLVVGLDWSRCGIIKARRHS